MQEDPSMIDEWFEELLEPQEGVYNTGGPSGEREGVRAKKQA